MCRTLVCVCVVSIEPVCLHGIYEPCTTCLAAETVMRYQQPACADAVDAW